MLYLTAEEVTEKGVSVGVIVGVALGLCNSDFLYNLYDLYLQFNILG